MQGYSFFLIKNNQIYRKYTSGTINSVRESILLPTPVKMISQISQILLVPKNDSDCVKSVRIRSYTGPHFPAFGLNTERYSRIQTECGKMRTRITPNTDTFYAMFP